MQHLTMTTATNDPLPLFLSNSRCRSALASLPFRTAASRDANGSDVLVLALFADDHPCSPAKFQEIGAVYDLSTVRHPTPKAISITPARSETFRCPMRT